MCDIEFANFFSEESDCSTCCALYGCVLNPNCPVTPPPPDCLTTPATPSTLSTAETPDIFSTPSSCDTPSTAETPDSHSTPGYTETPSTADTPSNETDSTPATASTPETPDTPATPITPSTPATPSSPETPTPETPSSPESPSTPSSPETPTPETPTPATDSPIPDFNCSNNITVCIDQPDGSVSLVNGTCSQYIVCVGGCANIMSCPNNLQYNLITHICDYPENVDCPWETEPPATGPSGIACPSGGRCAQRDEGTHFPSLNSCSKYVVCQCECEVEMECAKGLLWDSELLTCNHAANVNCTLG